MKPGGPMAPRQARPWGCGVAGGGCVAGGARSPYAGVTLHAVRHPDAPARGCLPLGPVGPNLGGWVDDHVQITHFQLLTKKQT